MEKEKTINVYYESEELLIRIVSDPSKADIVIDKTGAVVSKTKVIRESKQDALAAKTRTDEIAANKLEIGISDLLKQLGILPNIKGYRYTIKAIMILVEDPKLIDSLSKKLYPAVAESFGTSPSRVERAIRHGVEASFKRGDIGLKDEIFSLPLSSGKSKLTNSEFLSCILERFTRLK